MENPGCVGEEVPAVASSCYEEFSQPKVDEAKQEVTASSCPECGEALLRPEARFCSFCGSKLQLDKVPKQKGSLFCIDFDLKNCMKSSTTKVD